jgi:sarcosine oxidase subunit alpha
MNQIDALRLVGFKPVDPTKPLTAGSHFITKGETANLENDQGWMSSVAWSPVLGHSIGLGFIKRGHERSGELVRAVNPAQNSEVEVEIVSPHFYDPEGGLQRA